MLDFIGFAVCRLLFVSCLASSYIRCLFYHLFFFKQKTAYEMRISDWSSDVCSSDLVDVDVLALQEVSSRDPRSRGIDTFEFLRSRSGRESFEIGRASCRERVCQYV